MLSKNFDSRVGWAKLGQSSPKLQKTCYGPTPLIVPNLIAIGKTMYTKSIQNNFHILQYFGVPGESHGLKFTNLGTDIQQGPLYQCAKFRPGDNLSMRYLLPTFVDFVDSVTDKQTYKKQ